MNEESSNPSRLGRGLGAMFNEVSAIKAGSAPTGGGFLRIPIREIPLTATSRAPDAALIASVRQHGVLQPVLVARTDTGYRLLAGARRVQAAQDAGLADVPALIIPPERAGALDVFLEENLVRSDLNEVDRMRLRDQWVRETGRDLEAARTRIPEPPAPPAPVLVEQPADAGNGWKIATLLLAPLCVVLLAYGIAGQRTPATATPAVVAETPLPPPAVDRTWMEAFRFPGQERVVSGNRLIIAFAAPCFDGDVLTPEGARLLNQLAAVANASARPLSVRLVLQGSDPETTRRHADLAAGHLAREDLPGVLTLTVQRDADAPGRTWVMAEIVPVD